MKYRKLGRTGLEVSAICLGCMSFGEPQPGRASVELDEERPADHPPGPRARASTSSTRPTCTRTAAARRSSAGPWRDFADRDEMVMATKVNGRDALRAQRRRPVPQGRPDRDRPQPAPAGTEYVDLYQIHRFDPRTPVEETLEALHDVVQGRQGPLHRRFVDVRLAVRQGPVHVAERHGWTRFVTMQDHYNLLYREEEREMLPLCADQGIGVIPWSPLARGRLTRDWDEVTERSSETDEFGTTAVPARTPTAPSSTRRRGGRGAWGPPGPGGAGLDAVQAGGHRADRRCHQASPPRRRRRGRRCGAQRRGDRLARGALRPARGRRFRVTAEGGA